MKKIHFIIAFCFAAVSLSSCKEDSDITSAFEISVSIPGGVIVDGKSASFNVVSNREWNLVGQSCSDAGDLDFSKANPEMVSSTRSFKSGVTAFTIPAEGVKVDNIHRGRLSLDVEDVRTGTKKNIYCNYDAYKEYNFEIIDYLPVVYNNMDFTFTVYCSTADRFVLNKLECPKVLESTARTVLKEGATYELANHRITFSIPIKIATNVVNEDFALNITTESGETARLAIKMNVIEFSFTHDDGSLSVGLGGGVYEWSPKIEEVMQVNCRGGFTIRCDSGADDGFVGFSTAATRNSVSDYKPELTVPADKSLNCDIYVMGTKPGKAKISITPTAVEGLGYGTLGTTVWVRPKAVLYVDGDFVKARNKVYWGESFGSNYKMYTDEPSGGWTGMPDRIGFSFREVGNDLKPNVGAQSMTFSVMSESGLTEIPANSSMYFLTFGFRRTGSWENLSIVSSSWTRLSSLPASCQGFSRNITDVYDTLRNSRFSLKVMTEALFPKSATSVKSKLFWWDGTVVAYPEGNGLSSSEMVSYCNRSEKTLYLSDVDKKVFTYAGKPFSGYDDRLVFAEDNWTYKERLPLVNALNGGKVYLYRGTPSAPGEQLSEAVYPWKKSRLVSGDTNGLCYLFNKISNCMATSGRNDKNPWPMTSLDGASTDKRHVSDSFDKLGFKVTELSYDKSLVDVVGVVYGYQIIDDANNLFRCGTDYWWHAFDSTPWWQDIKDVVVNDNSK